MPDDDIGRDEQLCYFHLHRARGSNPNLKLKLEQAVARGAYLGEAQMADGLLREADLAYALLPWANLDTADLSGARLWHADLSGAYLWGGADLSGAVLVNADLSGAVLWTAIIRPLHLIRTDAGQVVTEVPNLRGADFTGALLGEATIAPEADLSNVKWGSEGQGRWSQYHIQDERSAHCDKEWDKVATPHGLSGAPRPGFDESQMIYRQLKLNYQESGDYQTAGEFFLREMECKRAQMVVDKKPLWSRIWPAIMYFVCGYGERPKWIACWGIGIVVLFAFLHAFLGSIESNGSAVVDLDWGWYGATALYEAFCGWWTALYFSVVTFTSLGYGDLAPGPGAGRLFAGVEAMLGIVLMSLFLICIVRKYSR